MEIHVVADHVLVEKYMKGDQLAIEQLVDRYKNQVYSFIFHTIKNQSLAEDIFQETFIKVIKSLNRGNYRDNGKFLPWVLRIAHNLTIDHFRREKQMKIVPGLMETPAFANSRNLAEKSSEDIISELNSNVEMRQLLQNLPEDQRQVVIMRFNLGLSFKEIANLTDVSINTALGRMRYAIINIRKQMKEKNIQLV